MRPLALIFFLLCSATCITAHASPLFELLGGVGDRAGLNGRATGASAASTYFNPALLPNAEPDFEAGVFVFDDAIELSLDPRSGVDVPVAYRGATHANGSVFAHPSLPTAWLRRGCSPPQCKLALDPQPRQSEGSSGKTRPYQMVGLVNPLIGPRLVFGFYALVPLTEFTSAHSFFVDEREQFFTNSLHPELESDRMSGTSLALGLGSRVLPRLSLGVSFTIGLHNETRSQSFVGNADDLSNTLVVSNDIGVEAEFAPHVGVNYDATDRLHLSGTVHSVQQFDIVTDITTLLPNGNKQSATRSEVHDYLPWRFGLGVSYDVLSGSPDPAAYEHALTLCASAVLGLWSHYLDRQGVRPAAPYAWSDTVTFALGARHSYGPVRSYLDLQYVPTPVPLQTGRTNYVDNDRIGSSAGFDYRFLAFALSWRVGLHAELQALLQRDQQKLDPSASANAHRSGLVRDEFPDDAIDTRGDPIPSAEGLQTNNPGWPGFSSRGLLVGGGVTLALLL